MADLILNLQVVGGEQVGSLKTSFDNLAAALTSANASMAQSAAQAKTMQSGFATLNRSIQGGFKGLADEMKSLTSGLTQLGQQLSSVQAAASAAPARKSGITKIKEDAEEGEVSVKQLRAALQSLYESQLVPVLDSAGSAIAGRFQTPLAGPDLRAMHAAGVQFTPDDRVRLLSLRDQLKAEDTLLKERAKILARSYQAEKQAYEGWITDQLRLNGVEDRIRQLRLQRMRDADAVFNKEGKNQTTKQLDLAAGAKSWLDQGRGIDEVRAKFGSLATAIAQSTVKYEELKTKALSASSAMKGGVKDIEDKMRQLDASFAAASTSSKFRRASEARAYLEDPNAGVRQAEALYGRSAVMIARNSKEMAALGAATYAHQNHVNKATESYKQLHTALRGAAGGMRMIWLTWGQPLSMLWAGFAAATAVKSATQNMVEFTHQLTVIQNVASATTNEIKDLSDTIMDLTKRSALSPVELASGAKVLAQAGLSAAQTRRALPVVSQFSQVGEVEPKLAAESLIGISSAFGMPTDDLSAVGDKIAKAAAVSQTSIENMTSAMRTASVIGEQYKADLDEVSAALALLAARNIVGSAAGTAMRNMFHEMYTPTKKGQEALEALNFTAFKANGGAKTLTEAFSELRESVQGFDPKSQLRLLNDIFGERGGKIGAALLADTQKFKEFLATIKDSKGFLSETAAGIQQSLKSQFTEIRNIFQSQLIAGMKESEGALDRVAKKVREFVSSTEFLEKVKTLFHAIGRAIEYIVENADTIGNAFKTWIAYQVASAATRDAGSIFSGLAGLAGSTGKNAVANVGELATKLGVSSKTMEGVAASASKFAGIGSALLITLGPALAKLGIDVAVTAGTLKAAEVVWDDFGEAMRRASNKGKDSWADFKGQFDRMMADVKRDIEALLKPEDPSEAVTGVFNIQRKNLENEYNAQKKAIAQSKASPADQQAQLAAAAHQYGTRYAELNRMEAALKFERDRLADQQDEAKVQRQMAAVRNNTLLGQGDKTYEGSEGGKGRTYSNAALTIMEKTLSYEEKLLAQGVAQYEFSEHAIKRMKDARILTEEQHNQALEALLKNRADFEVAHFTRIKDDVLPELDKRVREDISKKYKGEGLVEQLEAHGASMKNAYEKVTKDLELASLHRDKVLFDARMNQQERFAAMDDFVNKAVVDYEEKTQKALDAFEDKVFKQGEKARYTQAKLDIAFNLELAPEKVRALQLEIEKVMHDFAALVEEAESSTGTERMRDLVYSQRSRALEEARERAGARFDKSKSSKFGAEKGLRKVVDESEDYANNMEEAVTGAFSSMESALTRFVETGKFSMSDLVGSIIADFAKLAAREVVFGPLAKGLLGALQGFGGGGAAGGAAALDFNLPIGELLATVGVGHTGGIAGSLSTTRRVPMSTFAGAPRFHDGGAIGKDEVPIIAQRGERVLSRNQNEVYERGMLNSSSVVVNQTNNIGPGVSRGEVLSALKQNKAQTKQEIQDGIRRGQRGWSRDR